LVYSRTAKIKKTLKTNTKKKFYIINTFVKMSTVWRPSPRRFVNSKKLHSSTPLTKSYGDVVASTEADFVKLFAAFFPSNIELSEFFLEFLVFEFSDPIFYFDDSPRLDLDEIS